MTDDGDAEDDRKQRQLRLLGVGTTVSALIVLAASQVSSNPYEPLVGGLAFLGIAAMVFEYTEGMQRGVSMGFLVSGVLVWLYPVVVPLSDGSPVFVGVILLIAGLFNVAFAPVTRRLQRLGERTGADETD